MIHPSTDLKSLYVPAAALYLPHNAHEIHTVSNQKLKHSSARAILFETTNSITS